MLLTTLYVHSGILVNAVSESGQIQRGQLRGELEPWKMLSEDQAANPPSGTIRKLDLGYQKDAAPLPGPHWEERGFSQSLPGSSDTHKQGGAMQITKTQGNRPLIPVCGFDSIFPPYSRKGYDFHLLAWFSTLTSESSGNFQNTLTPRGRGRLGMKHLWRLSFFFRPIILKNIVLLITWENQMYSQIDIHYFSGIS